MIYLAVYKFEVILHLLLHELVLQNSSMKDNFSVRIHDLWRTNTFPRYFL